MLNSIDSIHSERVMSRVDAAMDSFIGTLDLPLPLLEAIRYASLGPGKRVRPLLAWHACLASGGDGEQSLPAGVSVELIHAFSLVHDDLPALDNDDMRRGRMTLHRHTSEAMAILAGDAMLTLAFAPLLRSRLDPARMLTLVNELVEATTGMIAGQVYDTLGGLPDGLTDEQAVMLIHRNKTGALIRASCVMGSLCAPGDNAGVREGITRYADAIGLMYQIVDDLLDVTQSSEQAGKRTGKDAHAGKATYPGVLGVDGSRARVELLLEEALSAIRPLGVASKGLGAIATWLAQRER